MRVWMRIIYWPIGLQLWKALCDSSKTIHLSWTLSGRGDVAWCNWMYVYACDCHVTVTWLSCDCHVIVMWLSCDCHVITCTPIPIWIPMKSITFFRLLSISKWKSVWENTLFWKLCCNVWTLYGIERTATVNLGSRRWQPSYSEHPHTYCSCCIHTRWYCLNFVSMYECVWEIVW